MGLISNFYRLKNNKFSSARFPPLGSPPNAFTLQLIPTLIHIKNIVVFAFMAYSFIIASRAFSRSDFLIISPKGDQPIFRPLKNVGYGSMTQMCWFSGFWCPGFIITKSIEKMVSLATCRKAFDFFLGHRHTLPSSSEHINTTHFLLCAFSHNNRICFIRGGRIFWGGMCH